MSAPSTPRTLAVPYWKPQPGDEEIHETGGIGGDAAPTLEVRANPLMTSHHTSKTLNDQHPKGSKTPKDQGVIGTFMPAAPVDETSTDSSGKRDGYANSSSRDAHSNSSSRDPHANSSSRDGHAIGSEAAGSPLIDSAGAAAALTTHTPCTGVLRPTLPNGVKRNAGLKICSRDRCVPPENSEHFYVTCGTTSPPRTHVAATSGEEDTRPAAATTSETRSADIAEGSTTTAATRIHWRDEIARGCRRQLAVATHYLNSSVFCPARPKSVAESRPSTTAIDPAAATAGRGFSAVIDDGYDRPTTNPTTVRRVPSTGNDYGHGCPFHDRPKTSGTLVSRRPITRDGTIWHCVPGDGRERAAAQVARLLSAPSAVTSRPSKGPFVPVPKRPSGQEEPTSSPRHEHERKYVPARGVDRRAPPFWINSANRNACSPNITATVGVEPVDGVVVLSKHKPACLFRKARPARREVEGGIGWAGEVGYTISSSYWGAPKCRDGGENGAPISSYGGGGSTPTYINMGGWGAPKCGNGGGHGAAIYREGGGYDAPVSIDGVEGGAPKWGNGHERGAPVSTARGGCAPTTPLVTRRIDYVASSTPGEVHVTNQISPVALPRVVPKASFDSVANEPQTSSLSVPTIPVDFVVHDVQSLLPPSCYDHHSPMQQENHQQMEQNQQHQQQMQQKQQQQQSQQHQQQCSDILRPARPRSAPLPRDPPSHTDTSPDKNKTQLEEENDVGVSLSVENTARPRPRSHSFDASADCEQNMDASTDYEQNSRRRPRSHSLDTSTDGVCEMPPGPGPSPPDCRVQRPHSARARYRRFEDTTDRPKQESSKQDDYPKRQGDGAVTEADVALEQGGGTFNDGFDSSNFGVKSTRASNPVQFKHAGGGGAADEDVDPRDETGSPGSISSSLAGVADGSDGPRSISDVGNVDLPITPVVFGGLGPTRGIRGGDGRTVTVTPRGCAVGGGDVTVSVTPRKNDVRGEGVTATGRGKMPTRDEVVRWGRDIDRLLKIRATRTEGETMMAVNGREQFMYSSGGENDA